MCIRDREKRAAEVAAFKAQTRSQVGLLVGAGALLAAVGYAAPAEFMQHFIVFALSCFIGFSVIWNCLLYTSRCV